MIFLNSSIGDLVLEELRQAKEASIAVAFFSPDEKILTALARIEKLTLIVSEEFTINNPYSIEKLKTATVLSVPPDSSAGKLHAKVLIIKRNDGSCWILLGSANLTHSGMFTNQEACVAMDSNIASDKMPIEDIHRWFKSLHEIAKMPDMDMAKNIFNARSQYRFEFRSPKQEPSEVCYWALKTTSLRNGKEMQHWKMFLGKSVIAIGWEDIPCDPSLVTDAQLRAAVGKTYPTEDVNKAVAKIKKFVNLGIGDIVLLCRGYTSDQTKHVHIHGVARVAGPFCAERFKKGAWRFKHKAIIQEINTDLPREMVAAALKKKSMRETIHSLDKESFVRLEAALKEFGVQVLV